MNRHPSSRIALALSLLLFTQVPASAGDFVIQLANQGSRTVSSLNLFPLDADGDFIEDNLGGIDDDIPPGGRARASISSECGPMLAVVAFADGSDLRLNFDSCRTRTLLVRDPRP